MKTAFRWFLVPPAAIVAYSLVSIAVGIASELDPVWSGASEEFRNFVSQLGNSIFAPIALVYAGASLAPTHRFVTSVILAGLFACFIIAGMVWGVYNGVSTVLTERYVLGTWWLVLSGAISLVAASVTCGMFYHERQPSQAL